MEKTSIGEQIKKIRIERGLTQAQLGDLCIPKMKDSAIRRYESGKVVPKTNTLQRIAKALNVSVADLDNDTYLFDLTDKQRNIIELFAGTGTFATDIAVKNAIGPAVKTVLKQINDGNFEPNTEPGDEILLDYFHNMNDLGKDKVINYAADIVENPKYKKDPGNDNQDQE